MDPIQTKDKREEKVRTSSTKQRRRIEIIDVAKCIAIFMVILGHTASNTELQGNPPMLIKILYSIHMPLFFFLSGLSIAPKPLKDWAGWRFFLRKTVLTIAIPYLLWALVYCNFNFQNVGWILYGSWKALGKTGTVTSLWYLSCLFCARIFVQAVIGLVSKYSGKRVFYLMPAAVCLVLGAVLPDIEIGYPWCLNIAFVASGFILMGIAVKNGVIELAVQKGWVLFVLLAASAALYAAAVVLCGDGFITIMMCKGAYGNPFFALAFSLLGGFAVLVLSMILKRAANEWLTGLTIRPLLYLGQHTMGVFLLHKPILQNILLPALGSLGIPDLLIRLLATFAALLASMPLCRLIEYYIPELIGIFSKDVIAGKNQR